MHRANDQGRSKPMPVASPFLTLIPGEWNPIFETARQDLDYRTENTPLIETRGVDESVARTFMHDFDESDVCLPQADKVEAYCFGANLERLRAEEGKASQLPVAYLDERSFVEGGGPGRSRPYRMPLTSPELYRELMKPRFYFGDSTHSIGHNVRADSESESGVPSAVANLTNPNSNENKKEDGERESKRCEGKDEELDADRRLIFITDLDRWSMYALMGTASVSQALGLRSAIYKHLAFENFIGATFPSKGLNLFQLAFHLPYYVWRKSQNVHEDHRRDANARPLRQSRDVSFLDWKSSGSSSFLYEAQISCLVSGTDKWRWVAYGFIDNYFDSEDDGKETVQQYHQESIDEDGMRVDPLTFGTCDSEKPIWNPRIYFLVVLKIRLHQVKNEWQQVVAKVEGSIREYIHTHEYSLSLSWQRPASNEAVAHDDNVRRSRNWVIQVRILTKQLLMDLSKTVNACEKFCLKYAVYFQNLSQPMSSHLLFASIQEKFDELESLKKTLESWTERCNDFVGDLEHQLILENIEVGIRQHKVSEETKWLSILMMYSLPIALAAGIFSMDRNVIPFLPASFGSFVGLVITFGILGVVIHFVPLYQTRCWKVVEDFAGRRRRRWDKKIRVPWIATLGFSTTSFFRRQSYQIDLEQVEQVEPPPS